jgi:hypothetical protein
LVSNFDASATWRLRSIVTLRDVDGAASSAL